MFISVYLDYLTADDRHQLSPNGVLRTVFDLGEDGAMDGQGFDRLTKVLANGVSRRRIVKWASAGIAGVIPGRIESARAQACGQSGAFCGGTDPPCCFPLQCAGIVPTCQPCGQSGAFCGGSYPSCCAGLQCAGIVPTCQGTAGTWGEPHVTTFNGMLYDFQASGDFVLAQRDPDFVVQARQVSLAPGSPEVSVNNAVAMRMGEVVIAVCLGQTPLSVGGQPVDLDDGQALSLPDGVNVSRSGNYYFVTGQNGDSVSAGIKISEHNFSYIDVAVSLGTESNNVGGLLGSPDLGALAASDGTIFSSPFSFSDLYQHYGESWRVNPNDSLLTACGASTEQSIPTEPFYLEDLDPAIAERARAVCIEAAVDGLLLDACTLDVTVIGDHATQTYAGRQAPNHVGMVVLP